MHEPFDSTPRDIILLSAQLTPDLAGPVAIAVCLKNLAYFFGVTQITLGAILGQIRVSGNGGSNIIRCWGDPQNAADQLDPKNFTVLFNKRGQLRNGRSSFAWAKYADAFFRISLAVQSPLFSRSSALN